MNTHAPSLQLSAGMHGLLLVAQALGRFPGRGGLLKYTYGALLHGQRSSC